MTAETETAGSASPTGTSGRLRLDKFRGGRPLPTASPPSPSPADPKTRQSANKGAGASCSLDGVLEARTTT